MNDFEEGRRPSEAPVDEVRTLEWDGITQRATNSEWFLIERDRLADAARAGQWAEVLDALREAPMLVNSARLGGTSGFTPLHQAAYWGAPMPVVEELLRLGAFRTLRTSKGDRAVDVARRRGHAALLDILNPRVVSAIGADDIELLEAHFHALIRERARELVLEHRLRLPLLEPMTEFAVGKRFRFPVPGMYGGFSYWLESAGTTPCLTVESWSRIVGGSGQQHRVTPSGYELVDEGFV